MPLPRLFRVALTHVVGIACLVHAPQVTLAQGYQPGAAANEVTEFEGELKGVRGNIATVTREDGVDCMVMFPDEINGLEFIASALPAYLRRGTPIRFTTTLGPTGMPLTPVDKLEIIAPVNINMVSHSQRMKYQPGVNSADRKAKPRNGPMTGKVYVVGSLMMLSPNGQLAVQAGKTPVQTMVSPNAKLEIRANNLALAQPGDRVKVAGFYQPPDDTKVKAERMTVTTDRVFGETPAKPERKSKKSRKEKAADAEAPAAETPTVQ